MKYYQNNSISEYYNIYLFSIVAIICLFVVNYFGVNWPFCDDFNFINLNPHEARKLTL